nr:TPA_asm: NADH dehydrogenase subunit 3 [Pseudomyrmex elongatus]
MFNIMLLSMIMVMIPIALLVINMILTKSTISREKKSPFECGFDPLTSSRIPMSNQFFLVGLVFLVFDVEITLLLPMIFMFKQFSLALILSSSLFILILIAGIMIEYLEQSIEWKT